MTLELALARTPLPSGDPRTWLVDELVGQEATDLPLLLMGGMANERLLVVDLDPDRLGAAEGALSRLDGVTWTGGWGTSILQRDGRPVLVSFARIRWPDGTVFVHVWLRLPGLPPEAALAETYEGPLDDIAPWLAPLFPPLGEVAVDWTDQPAQRDTWGAIPGVRPPDLVIDVPDGVTISDVAHQAAHALEARFVTEGVADPASVAWGDGRIAIWWAASQDDVPLLQRIVVQLSRDPRTRAVGLYGLGDDEVDGEDVHMIALLLEPRDGEAIMWMRRFREIGEDQAEWLDDGGFLRAADESVGWFDEE